MSILIFNLTTNPPCIITDSCVGAVVEYFLDEACTVSAGTASAVQNSDLTCKIANNPVVHDPRRMDGPVYSQLHCTNSAEPPRLSAAGAGIFE